MAKGVTPQSEDFSAWYLDVIREAELAENSPVKGSMIIKPYGYELWEAIQDQLDRRFKETGHKNAYFPLLIPESFLKKEAQHVEGFSPELAVVTHAGGKELEEALVVRPTSETIIGWAFARWIQSYRDLPLLINQWANVVRWELRTRPFLRTAEFLWQEGHTAHATYEDAQEETLRMLDIYADFAVNEGAVPVIKGLKSNQEKFAGADASYSIEAMMRNVWALQAGTSHNLGQNFARAFDITYLSEANEQEFCWTTSWGVSTRFIGAVIMAHGDDQGLRLPPRLAPIQTVIVPIYKNDDERSVVMPVADRLFAELKAGGVRVHMDDREQSPGFKFNDWEMRGVPIRMEVGPKDVEKESAALARRDVPGKAGKGFYPQSNILETVKQLLSEIHEGLLQQATDFRDSNLHQAASLEELTEIVESGGWALTAYDGSKEAEDLIKDATKATSRCFPLKGGDVEPGTKCAITGREAVGKSYFARAF